MESAFEMKPFWEHVQHKKRFDCNWFGFGQTPLFHLKLIHGQTQLTVNCSAPYSTEFKIKKICLYSVTHDAHRRTLIGQFKDFNRTIYQEQVFIYSPSAPGIALQKKKRSCSIWFKIQLHVQRNTCNHLFLNVALVWWGLKLLYNLDDLIIKSSCHWKQMWAQLTEV